MAGEGKKGKMKMKRQKQGKRRFPLENGLLPETLKKLKLKIFRFESWMLKLETLVENLSWRL
jgi:hypothetical protein